MYPCKVRAPGLPDYDTDMYILDVSPQNQIQPKWNQTLIAAKPLQSILLQPPIVKSYDSIVQRICAHTPQMIYM